MKFYKNVATFIFFAVFGVLFFNQCDDDNDTHVDTTTITFKANINNADWLAQDDVTYSLLANYYNLTSAPSARISNDTLSLAGFQAEGTDTTGIVMFVKLGTPNDIVGTYPMSDNFSDLPVNKALAVYLGKSNDIITYAQGASLLTYAPGGNIHISKSEDKKISGTFNFTIIKKLDGEVFYEVKNGEFKNLPLK